MPQKAFFVANQAKTISELNWKPLLLLAAVAVLLLVITLSGFGAKRDFSKLSPTEVVQEYYEAFGRQDYAAMYALMSDGFKKVEPTAKDFETFKSYISKYYETADGVKVLGAREVSNDGMQAVVDYEVELFIKTGSRKVESEFVLKKKENGWKLVHPYGLNPETE